MIEPTPVFVRSHIQILKRSGSRRRNVFTHSNFDAQIDDQPKWPKYALVIDSESTTDERQALTLGFYRFCRLETNGSYNCIEEGLFYADDLQEADTEAISLLRQYVKMAEADTPRGYPSRLRLLSRDRFLEQVFWPAMTGKSRAMLVCFNLPFDLSRLAVDCRKARRRNEGWSLVLSQDTDPNTGELRMNPLRERVVITPINSKAAFVRFAGVGIRSKKSGKRLRPYVKGRFLDLRTLGWALRNESYSLQTLCEVYGVRGKLDHEPTGGVTLEEIEYCRQDVRATVDLLNAMRIDFERHPVNVHPDRAYSPASIAKAYLKEMAVIPPLQKSTLGPEVLGAAMQAYYGGRAECRIRHTPVPVVHTDFMSEYTTVNTLMGLWSFLIAERLTTEDATDEVRDLLKGLSLETAFKPSLWKRISFYALVQPEGDILPVRTTYDGDVTNIGVNPLRSNEPIWYAGPDLVAATVLTGRPPIIIKAFKIVRHGQQADLHPTNLRNMIEIDPRKDDFFKAVIESRARVKSEKSLPDAERDALRYFLKILANAGSYGLFVEVNPERLGCSEETSGITRAKLRVFSGENVFEQTSSIVEKAGAWYCPIIAALITAGGRLLLALLERVVTDAGGTYLFCDTDSMAIVASETGGLVPCSGGPMRLPDGREAIKALSWSDVNGIVGRFEGLNPYDRNVVHDPILKIEDVNYHDGAQRELWGYAIAAKRYTLFTRVPGSIHIENPKAHGLGFLYPPTPGYDSSADAPNWVVQAWDWILRGVLGLPQQTLPWFDLPAMMRFTITTPEVLKVMQRRQMNLRYRDRIKPFNFIQSPIINPVGGHPIGVDPDHFTLIAPFTSDVSHWYRRQYVNVHDGGLYRLGSPGRRLPSQAEPQTLADVVSRYRWHPEAKSLAPDGNVCGPRTEGLLKRTPVTADTPLRYIGKETDRRWEQGEDISMLDPKLLEYCPNETARLVPDPVLQRNAQRVSIRALAKKAGVSERTVKDARRGDRLRRSTISKLKKALNTLLHTGYLPARKLSHTTSHEPP